MIVLPLLLLSLLTLGIGYFRLMQGPITVGFLAEPIKRGIDQGLPGFSVAFESVILTLGDTGGLELRLKNMRLAEENGEIAVSAPQAAIELHGGSLWSFNASPERVELIEPRIALFYSHQSGFSLNFSPPDVPSTETGAPTGSDVLAAPIGDGGAIDLAGLLSSSVNYSPQEQGAASTLRELGLRNATLVLDAEGRRSLWQVPRLLVDVEHRGDGRVISGSTRVSSAGRIWAASFRAAKAQDGKSLLVSTSIRDVVPSQIAAAAPDVDFLKFFNAPTSADIEAAFNSAGQLTHSEISIEVAGSKLQAPGINDPLATIDAGVLNFVYEPSSQHLALKPSKVRSGRTTLVLSGQADMTTGASGTQAWAFSFGAAPGVLGEPASQSGVLALNSGLVRGNLFVGEEKLTIEVAEVDLAGGRMGLSGEIDFGETYGAKLDGRISGLPVQRLAHFWPQGIAKGGRGWLRENVLEGVVNSGTMTFRSGRFMEPDRGGDARHSSRFAVAMEAENVVFRALAGLPQLRTSRALARFENDSFEVTVPEASMDVDGETLMMRGGRFAGSELFRAAPTCEVSFNFEGPASAFDRLYRTPALSEFVAAATWPEGVSGKLTGEAKFGFPIGEELRAQDVSYDIKARFSEGIIPGMFDGEDVKGASIDFHATPRAVDAKGEVLLKGVVAKLNWQRILESEAGRQPPLRLNARLDSADRKQLGINLEGIVTGEVPIEVTMSGSSEELQQVHVRGDLTPATLALEMIGWNKPAGRTAFVDFDVVPLGSGEGKTLKDFRVTGSDIAIEGEVVLDSKGAVKSFDFPNFSLDLVSRMSASGRKSGNGIWQLALDGTTYEGRAFFRSLFSVGENGSGDTSSTGKDDKGADITARIENVIGFEDVSLRGVRLTMSTRGGKIAGLDGRGTLAGGRPLAFEMSRQGGRRLLRVDSTDAGQVLKLVGFYPNMEGGRLRLEVNLDGRGPAEKTGTLWVENFKVLGDPVVSEVIGTSDESVPPVARRERRVYRQVLEFDSLRAPFSVGHGQIVVQDASMNGALLGATLRGKADFNQKTLDLGGTYVFLQGINNVFHAIPLLGELLSGPRKEGVFGTNYAIRGPMDRPQVYVHPLSTIAPGIFREIFQLAPESESVSPRANPSSGASGRPRSSSSPAKVGRPAMPGRTIEGWNSRTRPN
jgi:AsmA-like C-terminal region